MALSCGSLLKPQTPLQQLLEEINFQRTKEMRQLLKDDSGFVVLQGTTYWTDLFVRHFLFQSEPVHSIDSDDLLFFVRKKHVKGSSRHMPKYETEVDVYRKDSRKLPIGDPDVDWEETVYLNMVIHQFDYTLTLAICTRTSPKELQVLRRHSQRVYASPSRRKMDTKGEGEEMTYPHICFMVDNFDEVFSDILVRDGEMVCVELVANDKDGSCQGVIFLGSIRYDALKKVYDARQSSLSSKVAQRMTFGLFSSGAGVQTRCEFVRMKGPQGKGHAEMAVTKPKGSGVETPTSEPGFCATDMWDEWEEDPDDYYNYRNQRRLSDPSANLNNYSRYGWRTKNHDPSSGCKARSENEGLDSLASEVSEIEAGDLRDDLRPASSATEMKMHKGVNDVEDDNDTAIISPPVEPCCTNCFGSNNCKKQCGTDNESAQMSDIYCRSPIKASTNPINNVPLTAVVTFDDSADDENAINLCETPACLEKFPNKKTKPKHKNILNVESELIIGNKHLKKPIKSSTISNKLQTTTISNNKRDKKLSSPKKDFTKDKDKLKLNNTFKCKKKSTILPSSTMVVNNCSSNISNCNNSISKNNKLIISSDNKSCKKNDNCNNKKNELNKHIVIVDEKLEEYEIADDVTSLNEQQIEQNDEHTKIGHLTEKDSKLMIRVHGKEELPAVDQNNSNIIKTIETNCNTTTATITNTDDYSNTRTRSYEKCVPVETKNHPLEPTTIILNHEDNIQHNSNKQHDDDNNDDEKDKVCTERSTLLGDYNGNNNNNNNNNGSGPGGGNGNRKNCEFNRALSLPRLRKSSLSGSNQQTYLNKGIKLVPKRTTPDGTNIYYWCDLPKKSLKELDDGAYNPLWATKGFTQSFHFWKENRRQQSTPLNAFLTYVTLPWWSIAKDLLDHRETPILTF